MPKIRHCNAGSRSRLPNTWTLPHKDSGTKGRFIFNEYEIYGGENHEQTREDRSIGGQSQTVSKKHVQWIHYKRRN